MLYVEKKFNLRFLAIGCVMALWGCERSSTDPTASSVQVSSMNSPVVENSAHKHPDHWVGKPVVYQIFTRLFGNNQTTNKPWGTIDENGVGKFADITDLALQEIKTLGATHVWYTGVPHHALVADYTQFGISNDDPDVVKGRAGSPYAVKDYYNVNPDLAVNPAARLQEFDALIARTHAANLRVIIDIVPNHVARNYESISAPSGVKDFGVDDDTHMEYARDNNFYYVPKEPFKVPIFTDDFKPLGGENHPLSDGEFHENPAKWTGNGSRLAQPDINDWYETVKINYGVKPDGTYDFPSLPSGYDKKTAAEHAEFWKTQDVPNSWKKFNEIAQFWLARGVDGFRFDMAEMVPVEFWSYLNSSIKLTNPDAFLLAEIYNPQAYKEYIFIGKMDYLYDKVDLYDRLKDVIQGKATPSVIDDVQTAYNDIDAHLLRFLENHDEQRIAHSAFAGSAQKAKPAMVVTALLGRGPSMIYFGQEVGEPALENAGFGLASRTSIFDYVGVPHHQRWMNKGKFDGALLTADEKSLRFFYQNLLRLSRDNATFKGDFVSLQEFNEATNSQYSNEVYSFIRRSENSCALVVTNFGNQSKEISVMIPASVFENTSPIASVSQMLLNDGAKVLSPLLLKDNQYELFVNISGYGSLVLQLCELE